MFRSQREVAWVELEAGNELHVRLFHGRQDLPDDTILERIMAKRNPGGAGAKELHPEVVATFPQGDSWPAAPTSERHRRRVRRLAAAAVGLIGFVSLFSALSDPLRARLADVRDVVPILVPETADALTALAGVVLLMLARGIRRGQRRAWLVCQGLLLTAFVLHLVKGIDIEEAVVTLAVAAFLWVQRREFEAAADVPPFKRGILVVVGGAAATILSGTLALELGHWVTSTRHHHRIPRLSWNRALQASVERMVGINHVALPEDINRFFSPAMATASVGLVLLAAILAFRPVVTRRRHGGDMTGLDRARGIIARHGSGTLDYFALRPDKQFFFWGDTVVAHAVYGGVCLVSPDPVGPVPERAEAWKAFRAYVDGHGWALAGLGAGEEWLPIYRASGMHDLYVGDEGVVRIQRFALEGGRFKGLRQAVNRVAKYGYTISFHDPSRLDPELRAALEGVMTKSRRGDVERGFSMTLGRVFDPGDAGLLLAVVHGPPPEGATVGPAVAFCQYVPAPGIGGYALDLMRRDAGEHPNGLIDFAVVETIRYLEAQGGKGLGLNFATMRAVLAGEAGE
ncbi:MAG: bifunctional lysylphosphatidylglycerol flippase/synthetase MprF, partial [Acidimicrobiales bacterium]